MTKDLQSQFIISDRRLRSGDRSFPLTPSVASIPALPEDGSTLLVSRLQETHSPSQVRHLPFRRKKCPLTLYLGHDSSISIAYPNGPLINIRLPSLPFVSLVWTSENALVAAGHDCRPVVFAGSEAGWQEAGTLDDASAPKSPEARAGLGGHGSVGRLNTGAFAAFRNADTRGQSSSATTPVDSKPLTIHQNTITNIRAYDYSAEGVSKVSTSGVDGLLVIWDVDSVTALTGRLGGAHLK